MPPWINEQQQPRPAARGPRAGRRPRPQLAPRYVHTLAGSRLFHRNEKLNCFCLSLSHSIALQTQEGLQTQDTSKAVHSGARLELLSRGSFWQGLESRCDPDRPQRYNHGKEEDQGGRTVGAKVC